MPDQHYDLLRELLEEINRSRQTRGCCARLEHHFTAVKQALGLLRSDPGAEWLKERTSFLNYSKVSHLSRALEGGVDIGDEVKDAHVQGICTRLSTQLSGFLEAALDGPETRLASYGSLRPGECNHSVVAEVRGHWVAGVVRGNLTLVRGYPRLTWNENGQEIPCQVLCSEELPRHWARLDDFEGKEYVRILVPVVTAADLIVCNAYAEPLVEV